MNLLQSVAVCLPASADEAGAADTPTDLLAMDDVCHVCGCLKKKALFSLKRALYFLERALYFLKRALYLYNEPYVS